MRTRATPASIRSGACSSLKSVTRGGHFLMFAIRDDHKNSAPVRAARTGSSPICDDSPARLFHDRDCRAKGLTFISVWTLRLQAKPNSRCKPEMNLLRLGDLGLSKSRYGTISCAQRSLLGGEPSFSPMHSASFSQAPMIASGGISLIIDIVALLKARLTASGSAINQDSVSSIASRNRIFGGLCGS